MKSDIFEEAMHNRNRLEFLYGFDRVTLEPYYISKNREGKKVIFGRVNNSHEIKMFEFDKIVNIRVLKNSKYTPIIPIYYSMN
ncbi:MAG: hypothetical protein D6830_04065 [Ignavibacteria bacterium]|nr:MAG: hypothetical protein D6830_04065 [Ignavibacteria bacterium]